MSSDLQWMLIRKTSCYISKKRNVSKPFSKDPFNLRGVHSKKYDSLINKKFVGITPGTGNQGLVMTYRNKKHLKKPIKSLTKVTLRKGGRKSLESIRKFMVHGHYRPELKKAALRKASAILKSQRPVNLKKKGSRKKAE